METIKNKGGRPIGSTNKFTKTVKDMVEKSIHLAEHNSKTRHGIGYLERMAEEQPAAYMTLIGKLIPAKLSVDTTVTIDLANSMKVAAERLEQANKLAIEQGEQAVTLPIIDIEEKETET